MSQDRLLHILQLTLPFRAVHGQLVWFGSWSVWVKEHYVIIKNTQVIDINFIKCLNQMCVPTTAIQPPRGWMHCIPFIFFPSFFPFISSVALFSKRRFYILKNSIILMQINTKLPTSIYPSIALKQYSVNLVLLL